MWEKLSDFIPRLYWLVVLVVFTLIFIVMQIPASWGAYMMTRGNTLGLTGVLGTVWEGRASMSSVEIDNNYYSLGELRWDLRPLSLLGLNPCADVLATLEERQRIEGRVCAGLGGRVRVTDASIDAPADLIQAGIPTPIDGRLSATISTLEMRGEQMRDLEGKLSWTEARVQGDGTWASLGSFAAEFSYDGEDAIVADVFHLESPIDLDVQATLALAGGVDLQGELILDPSFSDEIQAEEWLHLMLESPERYRYRVDMQL